MTETKIEFAIFRENDGARISKQYISYDKLIASFKRSNGKFLMDRALDESDDYCYVGKIEITQTITKV